MDESPVEAEQVAWERIKTAAREADSALSLAGLRLAQVPKSLKTLRYLTHLDLSGNQLTELPEWLGELTALELLVLRGNRLVQLPLSLAQLSRLAQLDAADNRLLQVPPELASLPRLSALELRGNPHLLVPPPAIVAQGSHAVLDYLRGLGGTAESAAEITLPSGTPLYNPAQDDATHGTRRKALLIGIPVLVIAAVIAITAAMAGAGPGQTSASSASLPTAQAAVPAGTISVSPNRAETATAKAPTTKHAPTSPKPTRSAGRSSTSATASAVTATSSSATATGAGAYPTAAPDVDLTLGRPATASSAMEDYAASKAVDGNTNTYWESQDGTTFPQTLTLDLGDVTTVGRFDFRLPEASDWNERTETFTILGSTDGTDFFTIEPSAVYTFNANSASDDSASLTIDPVHTRYIELSFTTTDGWPAAQIGELDVYS
ncbi:discoidin domain-containing protein [Actinospica sp.]|uniref:discoidin domain-containing protein n=1 Tax=Actinospica sp. TaxID=1872142 RepID=UPI002C080377|nr:discoidin domain-containing protein [Actinospica sp.]HWG27786.1 discoidin domain-containing protein [Actinospica sp.]